MLVDSSVQVAPTHRLRTSGSRPMAIIAFGIVAAVLHLVLRKTRFGRFIYASGDNPQAARIAGLPYRPLLVTQYVVSSCIAYVAGLVMAASVSGMNTRIFNSTMIYDVLLVVVFPRFFVGQHAVEANIIPERARVLAPDPVRVSVLGLLPGPSAVLENISRRLARPGIIKQSDRVGDRRFVLAVAPEHEEIIGAGDRAS